MNKTHRICLFVICFITAARMADSLPITHKAGDNGLLPYVFCVSSDIIAPGAADNILADITSKYHIEEESAVEINLTQDEKAVRTIYSAPKQPPGGYVCVWDGKLLFQYTA